MAWLLDKKKNSKGTANDGQGKDVARLKKITKIVLRRESAMPMYGLDTPRARTTRVLTLTPQEILLELKIHYDDGIAEKKPYQTMTETSKVTGLHEDYHQFFDEIAIASDGIVSGRVKTSMDEDASQESVTVYYEDGTHKQEYARPRIFELDILKEGLKRFRLEDLW